MTAKHFFVYSELVDLLNRAATVIGEVHPSTVSRACTFCSQSATEYFHTHTRHCINSEGIFRFLTVLVTDQPDQAIKTIAGFITVHGHRI